MCYTTYSLISMKNCPLLYLPAECSHCDFYNKLWRPFEFEFHIWKILKSLQKGGIDKDTFNAAMSLRVVKIMQMAEYLCAGAIESNDYSHYALGFNPLWTKIRTYFSRAPLYPFYLANSTYGWFGSSQAIVSSAEWYLR